jgi:hypothetical protein
MEEAGAGDFPEDSARIPRQPLGQLGAGLAVELAPGVEKVGAIKDSPHHVPLGEAQGVIPDSVEHAPIDLAFRFGTGRAGRAMPELRRSRRGCPLGELLRWCVTQRIVQPDCAEPTIPFRVRHSHLLCPAGRKLCYALDVLQPCRCDDGPLGQRGPQLGGRQAGGTRRVRFAQRIPSSSLILSMRRVPPIRAAIATTLCASAVSTGASVSGSAIEIYSTATRGSLPSS